MKIKFTLIALAILSSFALGRHLTSTKTITKTITIEAEKKVIDTNSDTNLEKHKKTTKTEIVKLDGTKETTETTTEDSETNKKTSNIETDDITKQTSTDKEVTRSESRVTISALGGVNVHSLSTPPIYGGLISKPIFGPVTIGIWYLTSGVGGSSIGFTF